MSPETTGIFGDGTPLPEPPPDTPPDPVGLPAAYLDYYRDTVLRKLDGLSEAELRRSRLPSGWTPLELLWHLACVERRWFRWGFTAEPVEDPWADQDADGRRHVPDGMTTERVVERFRAQCARSREIVASAAPTDRAAVGGRFATEEEAPTLAWILLHVLQEYARHAGHLDIVRELADGEVGE
ncbi:DinB family protein [Streptomyces macrosporus]|uniref:DinB family protein n=1 Tax=Streptomyces macrosporus TaxID=44032 RepID=A0ABN3K6B0_9ACTN